jgi:hypothetical protein
MQILLTLNSILHWGFAVALAALMVVWIFECKLPSR